MAPRTKGDLVIVYLEHREEWLDGTIVQYIRGFGYEVDVEDQGETINGRYAMKFVKPRTAKRARSRSRSRNRQPSEEGGSVVRVRRRSRSRGRPPKTESPKMESGLADWVWANVSGKAESRARERRSRSRSRGREEPAHEAPVEADPVVLPQPAAEPVAQNTPEPKTVKPEVVNTEPELSVRKDISSCPWFVHLKSTASGVLCPIKRNVQVYCSLMLFPLFTLKLFDEQDFIPIPRFLIAISVLAAFVAFQDLRRFSCVSAHVRSLATVLCVVTGTVFPVVNSEQIVTDIALSLVPLLLVIAIAGNARFHTLTGSFVQRIDQLLECTVFGPNKLMDMGRVCLLGEMLSLIVSVTYISRWESSGSTGQIALVCHVVFNLYALWNDLERAPASNGFLSQFYYLIYCPFIVSFPLSELGKMDVGLVRHLLAALIVVSGFQYLVQQKNPRVGRLCLLLATCCLFFESNYLIIALTTSFLLF